MKRTLSSALCLIVLVVLLAACQAAPALAPTSAPTPASTAAPAAPVVLTVATGGGTKTFTMDELKKLPVAQ